MGARCSPSRALSPLTFATTLGHRFSHSSLRLREGAALAEGAELGSGRAFPGPELSLRSSVGRPRCRAGLARRYEAVGGKRQEGKEPGSRSLPTHLPQDPSQVRGGLRKPWPSLRQGILSFWWLCSGWGTCRPSSRALPPAGFLNPETVPKCPRYSSLTPSLRMLPIPPLSALSCE